MVLLLGTPCANSGVKDTFSYFIEDSLLSSSSLAPTQWQPDVHLLAGDGIFTTIPDQTKRNKILKTKNKKQLMLGFPKEIAKSMILIAIELLSCTQKSYSASQCPILT